MHSCAMVAMVLAATAFGYGNARAASGTLVTAEFDNALKLECPYKAVANTSITVMAVMHAKAKQCVKSSTAFKRKMVNELDTDAYRSLFRSACTQVPAARSCISAVDAEADSCFGRVERKVWSTVVGFLDASITATCDDDGERVATMFGDEFKAMRVASRLRVLSCIAATAAQGLFDRETDLAAYTLRKYRSIRSGKECILNVARRGKTGANQFEHFMDTIIRQMKCLTPVTNEIVLCDTLDAGHDIGDFNN